MPIDRRLDHDDDFDEEHRPRRRDRNRGDEGDFADDPAGLSVTRSRTGKRANVLGIVALVMGLLGLLISLIPCIGLVGIPMALIGLVLGVIGFLTAGTTTGRGLPIAGTCVSLAGLLIGGAWLLFFVYLGKRGQVRAEEAQARIERQQKLDAEQRQRQDREFREGKAITLTIDELYDAFENNPRDADTNYRNKLMEVTGTVRRVVRDAFGRMTVEFEAGNIIGGLVKCEFPRDAQPQLSSVKPNQKVTIRGRCAGKNKKDDVRLENCQLLSGRT